MSWMSIILHGHLCCITFLPLFLLPFFHEINEHLLKSPALSLNFRKRFRFDSNELLYFWKPVPHSFKEVPYFSMSEFYIIFCVVFKGSPGNNVSLRARHSLDDPKAPWWASVHFGFRYKGWQNICKIIICGKSDAAFCLSQETLQRPFRI